MSVVPNSHERVMKDEDFIISKTDMKGKLTYYTNLTTRDKSDTNKLRGDKRYYN